LSPHSIVVLELEEGVSAKAMLPSGGEAVDLGSKDLAFRRIAGSAWPCPFAAIDDRTVVTGSEDLLREVIGRNEASLASTSLDRLLKKISPDGDVTFMVDLAAAKAAHWKLPVNLMDVWPAGRRAWHIAWETAEAISLTVQWSDPLRSELALVCEGETGADKAKAALDELVPAAKISLQGEIESIKSHLEAGKLTPASADQYKFLLDEGLSSLQAARCDAADGIVWLRMNWSHAPMVVAAASLDSSAAVQSDWLAAARVVDEANHQGLLKGIGGYVKAEGQFPAGASGGSLMPPETRLSWIATLLGNFGHVDWHRQLEFGYNWNDARNQPITRRALPEVVNPALGPNTTEAGFPVTHYVGVAGVGPNAGRLDKNDPRAGVFGYGRTTRMEDISRGASNTLAILGVADHCGPWAAGGDSTVRSLTRQPYVNGPDGFGSGQPDGMLAGMADGSVRFISKNTDPAVLEKLATIHGPDNGELALLDPKANAAKPPAADKGAAEKAAAEKAAAEKAAAKPPVKPEDEHPAPVQPTVDVRARLDDPIPQISLPNMSLSQAVDLLMGMSTVPISFDPEALQELGVTLRDPISVELSEATVGKALEAIVASRNLAYVVENGHLLITSPAEHRDTFRQVRYTVTDLTGQDAKATAEIANLVQKVVAPDAWQPNGGRGTIEADDRAVAVTQNGSVHYQVLSFCEKLRVARGKPTRSRLNPDLFALTTRVDRAKPLLGRTVTANFREPTPLTAIVNHLKKVTDAEILIDRPTLFAAGIKDDVKGTLKIEKQPLATALGQLLTPLGLAWRAIDANTIQITTRKALASRLELEFYQVGSLLGKQRPAALIGQIKERLPEATWSEGGGPGVIYFDEPSQCLIVLQSQPIQIALEAVLAGKAN
jgi:hypothetical protein